MYVNLDDLSSAHANLVVCPRCHKSIYDDLDEICEYDDNLVVFL